LAFAPFLVWRLWIGACGVGACGVGACGVGACVALMTATHFLHVLVEKATYKIYIVEKEVPLKKVSFCIIFGFALYNERSCGPKRCCVGRLKWF